MGCLDGHPGVPLQAAGLGQGLALCLSPGPSRTFQAQALYETEVQFCPWHGLRALPLSQGCSGPLSGRWPPMWETAGRGPPQPISLFLEDWEPTSLVSLSSKVSDTNHLISFLSFATDFFFPAPPPKPASDRFLFACFPDL